MPANSTKLLLDENLSRTLIAIIEPYFAGCTHVAMANLLRSADTTVWDFAKSGGYCIVTKDWDFKFMSVRFGCPPKIVRLNCGNKTTLVIAELLVRKAAIIQEFLDEPDVCYLEIE